MGEKRNDYIDYILKWENKDIILSKIHRQCFRDNSYPPDSEFQLELIPETKEKCYIFTWETGMAPPDMEIDIVIDRNTPSDLEGKFPKKRHLHRHDFFEILYVYSGQCVNTVCGVRKVLKAGDISLYNLQVRHRVEIFRAEDVVINVMIRKDLFQRSFLDLLAENDMITDFFIQSIYHINNRAQQIVLHRNPDYRCEDLIQVMTETFFQNQPMNQSVLKAYLVLLLAEITKQHRSEMTCDVGSHVHNLSLVDVISFIDCHYTDISLEMLAEHFGYTVRSMTRYMKANTGMTFKEIVQQLRMQQACRLLRKDGTGIQDIAADVGYTERGSFDKAFKSKYRVTPAEYRKMYQGR